MARTEGHGHEEIGELHQEGGGFVGRYAGLEEIDYFECQLELQQELQKRYNSVERIIAESHKCVFAIRGRDVGGRVFSDREGSNKTPLSGANEPA